MYEFARIALAASIAFVSAVAIASTLSEPEISQKIDLVGAGAYSVQVHKVAGATAEEMVRNLAAENYGEPDENFVVLADPSDLDFSDQSGWGTLDAKGAVEIYGWMDAKTDENGDELATWSEAVELGEKTISELADAGLEFGFTDGSSGYCGVSFMGLLIVDVKKGVIYEISLTDSGPC